MNLQRDRQNTVLLLLLRCRVVRQLRRSQFFCMSRPSWGTAAEIPGTVEKPAGKKHADQIG